MLYFQVIMITGFTISWQVFETIQLIWVCIAVVVFFLLLKVTAPYGRHSSAGWGPLISNKWGWMIMESPVLILLWIFLSPVIHIVSAPVIVMAGLFSFHYINRVFVFPFRIHTAGKKMPVLIMISAIVFNLVNGFSLGYYFSRFADYSIEWFTDIRFITGIIIFFAGMFINWKADNMLIRLRERDETGYKIPHGWLFEKISCPNLFGEMLEWSGFALLCWNLPALSFLVWTFANLVPRALSHHRWYKENFDDYPASRKAIIPGLI